MLKTENKYLYLLIKLVYILIIGVTFSSFTSLPKMASMLVIPIAFIIFLVRADFDRLKAVSIFAVITLIGISIVYIISVGIWIYNIEETMYIKQGTSRIFFQLINVLVALSAVYIFEEDAIEYTLYGAAGMNFIKMIRPFMVYGPAGCISSFITTLQTGDQVGFMSAMEIQDVSYVYCLFVLYYAFASKASLKKRVFLISISTFFAILGFKRIIFASVAVGVFVGLLFRCVLPHNRKKYTLAVSIAVAVFAFLYVPFIRFDMFAKTMAALHINTNTRAEIYDYIKVIYEFTPTYIGKGLDYVVRYLVYIKTLNLKFAGASLKYIHNDILLHYIEMGFFGYIGWLFCNCIFSQWWFNKHCGSIGGLVFCTTNIYGYINYSVGNTSQSYSVRLALGVILISTACAFSREYEPFRKAKGIKSGGVESEKD